jgi:hypothetical protein
LSRDDDESAPIPAEAGGPKCRLESRPTLCRKPTFPLGDLGAPIFSECARVWQELLFVSCQSVTSYCPANGVTRSFGDHIGEARNPGFALQPIANAHMKRGSGRIAQ